MTYDPNEVLANLDAHRVGVLLLCGVAMVPTYVWFIEAIRVARRDRTYSMPLACTFFWFAHDTSFLARYDKWFNQYDHWYVKMFWVMLVLTVAIELTYIVQAIRYRRDELAPGLSTRTFSALFAVALAGTYAVWLVVKAAIGDDLYVVAFGLTVVAYPIFGTMMTLRRRSAVGQSVLMWVASLGLPIGWFSATTLYFGPAFRSFEWIALGVVSFVWGLAGTWLVWHFQRRDRTVVATAPAPSIVEAVYQ